MKKRLLALLLALCLVAALLPTTALASGSPFQDVKPNDWFYKQVQYVYENDLMSGTGASTFSPKTPTNRGMVAFILYKLEGEPPVSGSAGFIDVTSQYFAKAVTWAVQNKIAAGMGNNRFVPNGPVTREQLALMLYNYAKYKGYDITSSADLTRFSDYGKIHTWGREALAWANSIGLISGTSGNRIDPTGNALRGQMAVILCAFCQRFVDEPVDPDPGNPTPAPSGKATVRFDYNYTGAPAGQVLTVEIGQKVEAIAQPTREGYTFLGWYTRPSGGNLFSFDTAVSGDMTLYAQWSGTQTVQVAFDLGYENSGTIPPVNVVPGQLCPELTFTPQRENYKFDGWFTSPDENGVKFDFAKTPVTANMTLYAHWVYDGPNWAKPYQTSNRVTYYDGTNPLNNFKMMGLEYDQGLVFSYSYRDDSDASFNLGGQYEVMTFFVGHIDNGGRSTETLYFYFDGGTTPALTLELTGHMSTEKVVLNVKNHTNLHIVRKGDGGYAYALANMLLLTEAEARAQEITTPAVSDMELLKQTNLASGQVVPYQTSNRISVYDGQDPLNNFKMMGIEYTQGVRLSYSYRDDSDVTFNLGGGFDMISFHVGHVDNGGRSEENIYVWADDELIDTIHLTGTMSTTTYSLNVQGVNKLHLARQGDGGYDYALADVRVYTAADLAQSGVSVPSPSRYEEVNQTNLAAGPVLPYQTTNRITLYDNSDPVNEFFTMNGEKYTQGVRFKYSYRDDTDVNFNLGKGFTTMTFILGHVDGKDVTEETLYFYRDNETAPFATYSLTGSMPNATVNLDVTGINNLRIDRRGGGGYDYALADITVS